MKLYELSPAAGSVKDPMRKGRGPGSGNGKTGGRGHKGQKARSGGGVRPGFEGGQMPLTRQLPKRGFKNYFRVDYAAVNVSVLNAFDNGAVVDAEALAQKGILKQLENGGLKILGGGDLEKKLTVRANAFSESAKQKIEAAGGAAEEV
ncbi:MAG: 50S ribosomal protein L15 [Clostridiaceae bacterium]|nr:50S ribosomal protein L15 [Clostridiales bacterium]MDD6876537.1 50S ribosomal protein L15 [Clostridiaceae bacterium]MDY3286120.1 50S ribosomal protein L15 [Eubacteriales bacterium]MDY5016526.1 50S ribosomal protein L15 [Eubacteriales bacterium]